MPLEISEVTVRVAVADGSGGPSGPSGLNDAGADRPAAALDPAQKAEIVETCVREVLRTLRMIEAR